MIPISIPKFNVISASTCQDAKAARHCRRLELKQQLQIHHPTSSKASRTTLHFQQGYIFNRNSELANILV
jgi:hypothetical protein